MGSSVGKGGKSRQGKDRVGEGGRREWEIKAGRRGEREAKQGGGREAGGRAGRTEPRTHVGEEEQDASEERDGLASQPQVVRRGAVGVRRLGEARKVLTQPRRHRAPDPDAPQYPEHLDPAEPSPSLFPPPPGVGGASVSSW